jgi:hypothetical protein
LGIAGASAYIAGGAKAALVLLATFNPWAALAFFGSYLAGESFGWGKWISMVPYWHDRGFTQEMYFMSPAYHRDDGRNNGVHWLANKIAPEEDDFRAYGWWALVLRGGLWWALPLMALAGAGAISWWAVPIGVAVLAFAFPVAYDWAYALTGERFWTWGEVSHGFLQGLFLALAILAV